MILSVTFVFASIVCLTLSSMPSLQIIDTHSNHSHPALFIIDTVCSVWFTAEYLLRLWAAPRLLAYVTSCLAIIDLASILPFYVELIVSKILEATASGLLGQTAIIIRILRLLRVVRVLRVFKLARYS